jgi:hypothetical protein
MGARQLDQGVRVWRGLWLIERAGRFGRIGGRPSRKGAELKSRAQKTLLRGNASDASLTQLSLGETYGKRRNVAGTQASPRNLEQSLLKREQTFSCGESLAGYKCTMKGPVNSPVDLPAYLIELCAKAVPCPRGRLEAKPALTGDLYPLRQRRLNIHVVLVRVPARPNAY